MHPYTPKKNNVVNSFARSSFQSLARDTELEHSFLEFSRKYHLELRIPNKAVLEQSPRKQLELAKQGREDRDATIYRRFGIHLRKNTLDVVLETFHERAVSLCKKWVLKPRGDSSVTPVITGSPKATNFAEREELKQLFEKVLQEHKPVLGVDSASSIKKADREITPLESRESSGTPRPQPNTVKRTSDDFAENLAKRPKSVAGRSHDRSFYGLSTNVSRESFIFSDQGPRVSQGTQTTVEASSQEKARWPPAPPLFSQNDFTEALDHVDDNPEAYDHIRRYLDRSSPTHSYSDFSSLLAENEIARLEESFSEPNIDIPSTTIQELDDRLRASWPRVPASIAAAPFAVIWEVLRILLHCKVEINTFELEYQQCWDDQNRLWRILSGDVAFTGKTLPDKCSPAAWNAGLVDFRLNKQAVVLGVTLTPSTTNTGPFFQVQLQPLKIDDSNRLARRFGSDRFVEMILPSIDPQNVPTLKVLSQEALAHTRHWVATNLHPIAGRLWKPFYVRSFRDGPSKKLASKSDGFEPEPKQITKDRFYLFAQDGDDFQTPELARYPSRNESVTRHQKMSVTGLIEWLLQPSQNVGQPSLKLFSRISLGLSRTEPTVVLEQEQFRHMDDDIRSPAGKVMNDGIGRMSPALARKVRDSMGLADTPAGFQGRIGSAKGFWILDVADKGDTIWIETYPSQRKWNCDFEDEEHRVFEVSSVPQLPTSASLNTQFLPILMQQASTKRRKEALRAYLRNLLLHLLNDEIEAQRIAMQDPLSCSAWVDKNPRSRRLERLENDQVPRLGSVPKHDEDRIQFFLAAGFDPLKQRVLWDMIWKLCKERFEELKRRINITVGRSVYAYMVVDFEGILAEDEVHLNFSSNFRDEISGFSDTHLHDVDVLVARSPAHYVSDIQKVKAVFKPELGALKDVIVFPSKGNVALADKLSGGDYDGDRAWVCWDPDIVNNFDSAPIPTVPDLFKEGFLSKRTTTFQTLDETYGSRAILKFLEDGLDFNTQPSFLGMCTAFKESLCYHRKTVSDATAVRLSTMLSNLVDQPKQGIVFPLKEFSRFKRSLLLRGQPEPPQPKYKADTWTGKQPPSHIIDYLKFSVMIPAVDAELDRLSKSTGGKETQFWDDDLASYFNHYNELRIGGNPRVAQGMKYLTNDLEHFHREVETLHVREEITFDMKVGMCFDKFQLIKPRGFTGTLGKVLTAGSPKTQQHTAWCLLRASTYYKNYYNRSTFIWWIIGSELQELKAKASRGGPIVHLEAKSYAAMRHDPKYIRARNARLEGCQDVDREDQEPYDI
ncbi:putative RNA dependent RNA polymerase-domain-containing protein [Seiridium unicorne]|uniref:RNA-dependent RNA polymerase n=1 Tax=Seiridium unicorne TaxID=138068 RepID=A0ABR2UHI2_9PEZI